MLTGYEDTVPQWRPIKGDDLRWYVWRQGPGVLQKSVESFSNRATALVVATTLNSEQRLRWEKAMSKYR
jgi:hypothetical protein